MTQIDEPNDTTGLYTCEFCYRNLGEHHRIEDCPRTTHTTEPTIDPSAGLIIDLEAEVKSIGNYLGCNENELWAEISKLISDQVAKARIEAFDVAFDCHAYNLT